MYTEVMLAYTRMEKERLKEIGVKIGKIYTEHGLPIDIALDQMDLDKEQKTVILSAALGELINHKRNSGASDAALDRARANNVKYMESFIKTGEVGIY